MEKNPATNTIYRLADKHDNLDVSRGRWNYIENIVPVVSCYLYESSCHCEAP